MENIIVHKEGNFIVSIKTNDLEFFLYENFDPNDPVFNVRKIIENYICIYNM